MVFTLVLGLISGCGDEPTDSGVDASVRDSSVGLDSGAVDASAQNMDGGEGPTDASTLDAGDVDGSVSPDAGEVDGGAADLDASGSDAGAPIVCSFNSDCPPDRRCECTEEEGCFCLPGARGTGQNGIDTCTNGNDCASAVCVEGSASSGQYYCSGECETGDDCRSNLPVCRDIAFVGRICIRDPEA
jgi:hypothetical protein